MSKVGLEITQAAGQCEHPSPTEPGAMPTGDSDGPSAGLVTRGLKVMVLMRGLLVQVRRGALSARRRRRSGQGHAARSPDGTWLRTGLPVRPPPAAPNGRQPRPSRAFVAHWHRAPDGAGYALILQPPTVLAQTAAPSCGRIIGPSRSLHN
jgi:hypothetical protein